jgi:hypothetical protein
MVGCGEDDASWIKSVEEPSEYEFSFMVIGDTQILTYYYPDKLENVYDYVLKNVNKKNVKHVFGLGDITDNDSQEEWTVAMEQITRMDGRVPYSVIRGNHDMRSSKRQTFFDQYFGDSQSAYSQQYVDCFKGNDLIEKTQRARNTVHEFSSSTRDYLVIALDYGPTDDVLEWASRVVESHPNHNVIVTTHAYITHNKGFVNKENSSTFPTGSNPASNNGDGIWEKFIKNHSNIVMVLCGHDPTDKIVMRQSNGVNGNVVTELLIDPQGMDKTLEATGMVATFYVGEDGKTVTVDYYSTVRNRYYLAENQFTFEIATVERA